MSSEFMLIIPASDQPLWQLKHELQELGGVRGDSFSPVPTEAGRYGYQVTPELYEAWQKAAGVQRVEADADVSEADAPADGTTPEATAEVEAEQAGATPGAEETPAAETAETDESGDAPQPAQGDTQSRKSKRAAQRSEQGKE